MRIASEQAKRTGFRGPDPSVGKATQFKPGLSGNPGGRPRKKPLTEAYEKLLNNPAHADAIAKAMVNAAKRRNVKAAIELADRVEGKVTKQVVAELEGGIQVNIRRVGSDPDR